MEDVQTIALKVAIGGAVIALYGAIAAMILRQGRPPADNSGRYRYGSSPQFGAVSSKSHHWNCRHRLHKFLGMSCLSQVRIKGD
jgi:hypothetical protein